MKIKVKKGSTALSPSSILLMCNYNDDGIQRKFIQAAIAGSTFEVADNIGAALLTTENLAGILSIDYGTKKAPEL
jgi:hypothetical protein